MTPEEHAQARQHCLTASRAYRLLFGNYKTWNTLARDMRKEQRTLGQKSGVPALDWGIDNEAWVRASIWMDHPEWEFENPGFQLFHGKHPLLSQHCGASPDGLILPVQWGYEGKAPFNPEIHDHYLTLDTMPEEYVPQVQWSLWVTGWPKWLFASGDPRRQGFGQLRTWVVEPDLAMHQKFEELAIRFLESYTTGEDFKPTDRSAKALAEMFK